MFRFTSATSSSQGFQYSGSGKDVQHAIDVDQDMDDDEDFESGKRLVDPGESIASAQEFMKGHGTFVDGDDVVASVSGVLQKVNKLMTDCYWNKFQKFKARYNPEVGDLVVVRILEVQPKRWKVDANARQDGILMLASVNLPGGIQRRKLESDELQMRTFFEEGDLLVAEVQAFMPDGQMSLHTRSLRYGKLRNGQLVTVPPTLIRRLKSHFFALPCGVDIILGINGYIWVSKHVKEHEQVGEEAFDAQAVYSNKNDFIDTATRTAIMRVTNIIKVLGGHYVPITDSVLLQAYDWVIGQGVGTKELLQDDVAGLLVTAVTNQAE